MAGNENMENKKDSPVSVAVGIALVLVVAPLIVSSAFYFLIPDFRMFANGIMAGAPGPIGAFFASMPTEEEKNANIRQIAEYMLSIDMNSAIDKLSLLSKEDEATFNGVRDAMVRINPNVTSEIMNAVRDGSVRQDAVTKMMNEMTSEKEAQYKAQAEFIMTLSRLSAKEEMNRIIASSINGYKDLSGIVAKMDPGDAAGLMELIQTDEVGRVLSLMDLEKSNSIRTAMSSRASRTNVINNAADIYSADSPLALVDEIGSTKKYKLTELPLIYRKLGPVKSGKLLARVEDSKFVFGLLDAIKEHEIITTGMDNLTKDIVTSLNIYKEFDDKVDKLAAIYEKVSSAKVALYMNELVKNSSDPKVYSLANGESIIITDENIAVGILNKFTDRKKGEVIGQLDEFTATEISKLLARP